MKRAGNLIEEIADFDNLALASYKAFKGKSASNEVKRFRSNYHWNILKIRHQILSGDVEVGNYNRFVIFEPKKRIICAAPLEQRVLHHAIMNICHRYFDKSLIYDCYASRPGKGVHKAVKRVMDLAGANKYYVKLDICKYFDSINHTILNTKLVELFKDNRLLQLFYKIIDSYGDFNVGLPIGNLTSQYFANYYLSGLDHAMKESAKCKVYIRYMDDVIMMGNSIEEIKYLTNFYCDYAMSNLQLLVKPPIVGRTCHGIPFLGFKIYPNSILLGGKAKRRYKRNITKLDRLFWNNRISEKEYALRLSSNIAFVEFADSYKFRKLLRLNVRRAPIE